MMRSSMPSCSLEFPCFDSKRTMPYTHAWLVVSSVRQDYVYYLTSKELLSVRGEVNMYNAESTPTAAPETAKDEERGGQTGPKKKPPKDDEEQHAEPPKKKLKPRPSNTSATSADGTESDHADGSTDHGDESDDDEEEAPKPSKKDKKDKKGKKDKKSDKDVEKKWTVGTMHGTAKSMISLTSPVIDSLEDLCDRVFKTKSGKNQIAKGMMKDAAKRLNEIREVQRKWKEARRSNKLKLKVMRGKDDDIALVRSATTATPPRSLPCPRPPCFTS